jgi:hypothetical protein
MSSQTELEQRLAIVEVALSQLQQQISTTAHPNWIAQIVGTFKDESAFDEILAYGREFRQTEPLSTDDLQSP